MMSIYTNFVVDGKYEMHQQIHKGKLSIISQHHRKHSRAKNFIWSKLLKTKLRLSYIDRYTAPSQVRSSKFYTSQVSDIEIVSQPEELLPLFCHISWNRCGIRSCFNKTERTGVNINAKAKGTSLQPLKLIHRSSPTVSYRNL